MDIFTTQLTRVVQTPIKPTNLKVKALLKDAAIGKLKEDPDHLENHDNYFNTINETQSQNDDQKQSKEALPPVKKEESNVETPDNISKDNMSKDNNDDKPDVHLDLYV